MSAVKTFVDTNIILDALMMRDPWAEAAQSLLLAVAEEKAEGYITANTMTDLYFLLRKHLHDNEKARQALLGFITSINILDVTGVDCEKAFTLPIPDYEDALFAYCGKRNKMDFIVTRNPSRFKGSPVKIIETDVILQRL